MVLGNFKGYKGKVRSVFFALELTILIMTLGSIFACLKQMKGNKLFIGEKR